MHYDVLIRGGKIVSHYDIQEADIGIEGEVIVKVGALAEATAETEINAKGLHVLPGIIDSHVHFREPGLEYKEDLESGTCAAILGGVTTIFEMPNTQPSTTSIETLQDKLNRAQGRAWCDHGFFVGASKDNLNQLEKLENAAGSPGIKIFMGSSTGSMLVEDDETLRQVLQNGKRRCAVHAEDEPRLRERKGLISPGSHVREHPFVRDAEAARLATERILRLSLETKRLVHILHVSTQDELPLLNDVKKQDHPITCEVTPQHLYFQAPDCYEQLGSKVQINPPIRDVSHRLALLHATQDALFDVIGSDHAPHTLEEKAKPYPESPSGMPGVQTMLPVMITLSKQEGVATLPELVRMMCLNPASIYGVKNKGAIRESFDADLVLLDPDASFILEKDWIQNKCGWSPYEGHVLYGKPIHVLLRGKQLVYEGQPIGQPAGKPVQFEWK